MGQLAVILKGLMKFLGNPKVQRVLIWVVIAIVVLMILSKGSESFNVFIKKIKPPSGEGIYNPVADSRKAEIEKTAAEIYAYLDQSLASYMIYGWGTNPYFYQEYFDRAKAYPNNELKYLADFYKKSYGKSLYKDLDEETFYNNWDTPILARLKETNLV